MVPSVHYDRKRFESDVLTWCNRRVPLVESTLDIALVTCQDCRLAYDDDQENLIIVSRGRRRSRKYPLF